MAIFGGFLLITLFLVHGLKWSLKGVFMVQKPTFLIKHNIYYLAYIWTWDMLFCIKTTVYSLFLTYQLHYGFL